MSTPDTSTPRTDAVAISPDRSVTSDYFQLEILARQLERELTAAKERIDVRDEERSALWKSINAMGVEAFIDGKPQYSASHISELAQLRTETQEQARLLGMSGEREADLRGEIERLRRQVAAADSICTKLYEALAEYVNADDWDKGIEDMAVDAISVYVNSQIAYRATEVKL